MSIQTARGIALCAVLTLAACGGGGGGVSLPAGTPTAGAIATDIPVPNWVAGQAASSDLGVVSNLSPGLFFFTDRNNKAVEVIDIASMRVIATIGGFTGCRTATGADLGVGCQGAVTGVSGPNGVTLVPGGTGGHGRLYVGDVARIFVIDIGTLSVTAIIPGVGAVGGSTTRADEGCYLSTYNLVAYSNNADVPPVTTLVSTITNTVVGKIIYNDTAGKPAASVEQCRYDPVTDQLFVNNDGTTANPDGEIDAIPGAAIVALVAAGGSINITAMAGVKIFPLGTCAPTGLALGPGNDIATGCRPSANGASLDVKIFDRTKGNPVLTANTNLPGALLATVNAGGGDQLEYDQTANRYYNASSRWNPTGKVQTGSGGACTAAQPCTPRLFIIDAATRTVVSSLPTGNNAHGLAVDPVTGRVFLPYSSATNPVGATLDPSFLGTGTTAQGTVNGGISVINGR